MLFSSLSGSPRRGPGVHRSMARKGNPRNERRIARYRTIYYEHILYRGAQRATTADAFDSLDGNGEATRSM